MKRSLFRVGAALAPGGATPPRGASGYAFSNN